MRRTVPKVEHDAAIAEQQAKYEERLKHLDEEKRRSEQASKKDKEEGDRSQRGLSERIERLESALADKQRTLDDVTSQLIELQDAFSKLSSKERTKLEAKNERERSVHAALGTLESRFKDALKDEAAQGKVELLAKDESLMLRFKDGTLFQKGSTRLLASAKGAIERVATAIKESAGSRLRIEAHSDSIRPQEGGERKETWGLTQEQGLALVHALQKLGIDPSRLSYTSFGQFRPLASNDTEPGRSSNRRVELFVEAPLLSATEKKK